jgi:tetratricopeptide (TPR) repeat protein
MIPLFLAAVTAIAPAQSAFDRGDYARAEALALHGDPGGPALYLAALARFRAGNPQGALELLERAGRAADPPERALWHFNQAACLYELGRYAEAESEYLLAAQDPSLSVVSLVDGAFAALDGSSPKRARELAAQARTQARDERALDLVSDLEAHIAVTERATAVSVYKDGLDAFDAGDYSSARERFLKAVALDPADGRSRIMAAASALRLGSRGTARAELDRALALHLDEADARTARAYLDVLGKGYAFEGTARFAGGVDSNPEQVGLLQPSEFPAAAASRPSALSSADLNVGWHGPLRDDSDLALRVDYGFSEVAYVDPASADRSLQQHALTLSMQAPVSDRVRGGVSFGGQMDFAGLANFREMQVAGRLGGFLVLDESPPLSAQGSLRHWSTRTRLDLSVWRKQGSSQEFNYLTGNRVDALLSQELASGIFTFAGGYGYRIDAIGSDNFAVARCGGPGCGSLESFGYTGHTFWVSARAQPVQRVSLELASGLELRSYLQSDDLFDRGGRSFEMDRKDRLFFAGVSASLRLTSAVALSARYDLVDNSSNVGPGPSGVQGRSYTKQVASIGTLFGW